MPQAAEFNPQDHQQDPTRALMVLIRGLQVGDRVRLPDGTVVKSVAVKRGFQTVRRFAVQAPAGSETPQVRHRTALWGANSYGSASEAAMHALGKGRT